MSSRINTRSAHNVQLWIKNTIASGRLKRCWNLDIDKVIEAIPENEDIGLSYFVPSCRHQSFEWQPCVAISDHAQLVLLQDHLDTNPISCLKDCTYHESRSWGLIRHRTAEIVSTVYKAVIGLWKQFAALPWPTQVALIVLIVLVISPKWAAILISLAKAVK